MPPARWFDAQPKRFSRTYQHYLKVSALSSGILPGPHVRLSVANSPASNILSPVAPLSPGPCSQSICDFAAENVSPVSLGHHHPAEAQSQSGISGLPPGAFAIPGIEKNGPKEGLAVSAVLAVLLIPCDAYVSLAQGRGRPSSNYPASATLRSLPWDLGSLASCIQAPNLDCVANRHSIGDRRARHFTGFLAAMLPNKSSKRECFPQGLAPFHRGGARSASCLGRK